MAVNIWRYYIWGQQLLLSATFSDVNQWWEPSDKLVTVLSKLLDAYLERSSKAARRYIPSEHYWDCSCATSSNTWFLTSIQGHIACVFRMRLYKPLVHSIRCLCQGKLNIPYRLGSMASPLNANIAVAIYNYLQMDRTNADVYCSNLKVTFRKYPAIHTNYIIPHCTTLQFNHNILHDT